MKTLTIFTPAYNRKHTMGRTYESLCRQTCDDFEWLIIDDGSSDGTREWVESLGEKVETNGQKFDWMGRPIEGSDENHFTIQLSKFRLTYIYKPNGGLYTGYNAAYTTIETELCVCIDSDDYMPDNAVERIVECWKERDTVKEYCGIIGLDFNVLDKKPIGGYFPEGVTSAYYADLYHGGDTKEVMRTDLMRTVAPLEGFDGEKDFNPFYMVRQIVDKYPMLVENYNFCWVEYQIGADSMSQGIYNQYVRSPQSYAKYRRLLMTLQHGNSWMNKFKNCGHYVSSCIFSGDKEWLKKSPKRLMTVLAVPLGICIYTIIKIKTRK